MPIALDETLFRGTRLCVVGSICRDVKTAPLVAGGHLFHDGETPTGFITETLGGGAANSALFAAGLGAEVRLAGTVGADALGDRLKPCAPARQLVNTAGTGDLLSACMILLHARHEIPVAEKLRLANRIVAEFIEGQRDLLPAL